MVDAMGAQNPTVVSTGGPTKGGPTKGPTKGVQPGGPTRVPLVLSTSVFMGGPALVSAAGSVAAAGRVIPGGTGRIPEGGTTRRRSWRGAGVGGHTMEGGLPRPAWPR